MKKDINTFKEIKFIECAFCEKSGSYLVMEAESLEDTVGIKTWVCLEHFEAIKNKNE